MQQYGGRTPFSELLLAVINSILEVFILCLSGYLLARHGIFDKKTQKQLNRLNVTLFTPALLFSKVAYFLTPAKLKELWIIPIWFTVVTVLSMWVGRVLGKLFHLRKSQKSFVMAAAMFMNSNSLPIALMQSLVVSVPDLAWGKGDNKDMMLGRALTYLTMYSTLGMVVRYSYGVNLLSRADSISVALPSTPEFDEIIVTESSPVSKSKQRDLIDLSCPPTPDAPCEVGNDGSQFADSRSTSHTNQTIVFTAPSSSGLKPFKHDPAFYTFPNTPNDSSLTLARYDSGQGESNDEESDEETALLGLPTSSNTDGRCRRFCRRVNRRCTRIWIAFKTFMTAPLWAALFSLIVAFIDPLKHALEHHLQPLNRAINTAGKCAIPLTLVVLGAYFYEPPLESDKVNGSSNPGLLDLRRSNRQQQQQCEPSSTRWERIFRIIRTPSSFKDSSVPTKRRPPGETKTVILAIFARMILTPLLLVPFLMLASKYDWNAIFDDPVFVTVNTILLCSPPALTLAQITAAVSGDAFERLISRTIFWSYCAITPPVTIGCVLLGLWLAEA